MQNLNAIRIANQLEQAASWASLAESHRLCREAQSVPHAFDEGDLGAAAGRCSTCDGLRRDECHTAEAAA